ncbi:hypothetical protein [Pantoea sp. 1B4]|uniref:hypothetical protein n=1 Tax=Pantoea sp. 1B4 TaxID=2804760 RepID=UPI002D7FDE5C|nr:hypothetical protein [Pantoea sp. 1B4]
MEIIAFLLFLLVTEFFIWSSKISYGRKTLAGLGKAFVGVFIAIIAIGFVLKGLAAIMPGFTRDAAGGFNGGVRCVIIFYMGYEVYTCWVVQYIWQYYGFSQEI